MHPTCSHTTKATVRSIAPIQQIKNLPTMSLCRSVRFSPFKASFSIEAARVLSAPTNVRKRVGEAAQIMKINETMISAAFICSPRSDDVLRFAVIERQIDPRRQ